jgi:hypothetical protein
MQHPQALVAKAVEVTAAGDDVHQQVLAPLRQALRSIPGEEGFGAENELFGCMSHAGGSLVT